MSLEEGWKKKIEWTFVISLWRAKKTLSFNRSAIVLSFHYAILEKVYEKGRGEKWQDISHGPLLEALKCRCKLFDLRRREANVFLVKVALEGCGIQKEEEVKMHTAWYLEKIFGWNAILDLQWAELPFITAVEIDKDITIDMPRRCRSVKSSPPYHFTSYLMISHCAANEETLPDPWFFVLTCSALIPLPQ
ncbi:hypothetical protein EZV62_003732 [Acer yangbiense]|uniref:Uncharacterized protein n=1 Tax=Acer yangbiense TaxID=1000413 RepID=A0A5C7IHI8_9ROSI|nr:hypothetical protein EZV62_003732 [Acer yangbiense]